MEKPKVIVPTFEHPQPQSMQPPQYASDTQGSPALDELTARVDSLALLIDYLIRTHKHDGFNAQRINFNTDILGLIEVVSVAPTNVPRDLFDQIKIYTNSTTYRLYWYDWTNRVWHYVTATA